MIIDYGFSIHNTLFDYNNIRGTVNYLAPEVFITANNYDPFKVDIYAVGCMIIDFIFVITDPSIHISNDEYSELESLFPKLKSNQERAKQLNNEISQKLLASNEGLEKPWSLLLKNTISFKQEERSITEELLKIIHMVEAELKSKIEFDEQRVNNEKKLNDQVFKETSLIEA